jgi:hypothetical protein
VLRHRLARFLATTALLVGLSGTALAVTAAPANAATTSGFDCSVSVDAPWHSPYSNRVYFNGGVHCWGDLPDIIQLYNQGAGLNGNVAVSTRKTCSDQYDCYSDGGVTYITYQGPGQYCGVVDAYVSSYFNVIIGRHYANKRCAWL